MQPTTLVFLVRHDEILLAMKKRGFGKGHWNGAGGKVQANEPIEAAMIRECQEEIGVTPQAYEKVAIHTFSLPGGGSNTCHTYICTAWTGEPTESDEMKPQWFAQNTIPYSDMWPDDILWLPQVLAGKQLETFFAFDKNNTLTEARLTFVKKLS